MKPLPFLLQGRGFPFPHGASRQSWWAGVVMAYVAPFLLLLVFAQGWTWLYVFPLALIVINGVLA